MLLEIISKIQTANFTDYVHVIGKIRSFFIDEVWLLAVLLFTLSCASDSDEEQPEESPPEQSGISLPPEMAFTTNLPVLIIDTPDSCAITSKTEWVEDARISLVTSSKDSLLQTEGSIRGRGNVTWNLYPKKSYSLKLSHKDSILGMKSAKRWVLLANWSDRTLLRNDVAFECSRRTSLEWTPEGRHVELILNGVYQGSYYICEKIQVSKNRLNIAEMSDNDEDEVSITGGYLMEIDDHYDEAYKFKSAVYHLPYQFREPDEDVLTEKQFDYMRQYVKNLEKAIHYDERLLAGEYEEWIDPQSFADWWLINELCYNKETGKPRSIFVYKPRNERLKAGPVWDYDFRTFTLFDDIYVATNFPYLRRLFKDPQFQILAKQRWAELRPKFEELPLYIDERANQIKLSAEQNILLWPITSKGNLDEQLTFDEAIESMKQSIQLRISVIDAFLSDFDK